MTDKFRGVFLPYDGFPIGINVADERMPTFSDMQKMVNGTIEATMPDIAGDRWDLTIWMNDEARLRNIPNNPWASAINWPSYKYHMRGDGLLLSTESDGETCGMTEEEWDWVRRRLDGAQPDWYDNLQLVPVSETMTFDMHWRDALDATYLRRAAEQEDQ